MARWARDEDLRKDKFVVKSDEEIQSAIEDALLYDPRVLSVNVTPDVTAGTATLRGEVASLRAKRAAASVARRPSRRDSTAGRAAPCPLMPGFLG